MNLATGHIFFGDIPEAARSIYRVAGGAAETTRSGAYLTAYFDHYE